jgi:hypothetical protein
MQHNRIPVSNSESDFRDLQIDDFVAAFGPIQRGDRELPSLPGSEFAPRQLSPLHDEGVQSSRRGSQPSLHTHGLTRERSYVRQSPVVFGILR